MTSGTTGTTGAGRVKEQVVENKVFGGRYRVIERVGLGGMAEVYKANDEVLSRTVAVKVMLPQYAQDRTFAARFRQEAQAAANLSSPFIVGIYDWGQDGETYYIAMEYVRGVDLKTAIQERGSINPRKVAEIGSQVCAGLSVAHASNVIHRDIKPQNIMIQPDGNAKIMDFGIARAGNASLTTTNSVLGTAHYVSPEQAQGKPLAPASDLYSLGVTMYEAATGQLPFDGPDAVSVAMKQVSEAPIPPSQLNPEIDPDLEAIILRAMEKHPEDRFASAAEMRNAIRSYLAGMPLSFAGGAATTRVINEADMPAGVTSVLPGSHAPATTKIDRTTTIDRAGNGGRNAGGRNDGGKKRGKGAIVGIIVAIVAVIAIAAGLVFSGVLGGGEEEADQVAVPAITGLTRDAAETELAKVDLSVGTVTAQESDSVPAGQVISQDPAATTMVDRHTSVNIVISSGVGQTAVPDLSNMTMSEAERALADKGLVGIQGDDISSDTVEKGRVVSQTPTAGSLVEDGSQVTYHLSSGEKQVPDVIGMDEESAATALEEAGFYVGYKYVYSSSVRAGLVVNQRPESGSQLAEGETVTISISLGPAEEEEETDTGGGGGNSGGNSGGGSTDGGSADSGSTEGGSTEETGA